MAAGAPPFITVAPACLWRLRALPLRRCGPAGRNSSHLSPSAAAAADSTSCQTERVTPLQMDINASGLSAQSRNSQRKNLPEKFIWS